MHQVSIIPKFIADLLLTLALCKAVIAQ